MVRSVGAASFKIAEIEDTASGFTSTQSNAQRTALKGQEIEMVPIYDSLIMNAESEEDLGKAMNDYANIYAKESEKNPKAAYFKFCAREKQCIKKSHELAQKEITEESTRKFYSYHNKLPWTKTRIETYIKLRAKGSI